MDNYLIGLFYHINNLTNNFFFDFLNPCLKFLKDFIFENLDSITRIKLYCIYQNAMFTECILFSTITN